MEEKTFWVISTRQNKLIHKDNKILFFETANAARLFIEDSLGNSPYLRLRKWKR